MGAYIPRRQLRAHVGAPRVLPLADEPDVGRLVDLDRLLRPLVATRVADACEHVVAQLDVVAALAVEGVELRFDADVAHEQVSHVDGPTVRVDDEKVANLVAMGFDPEQVVSALRRCDNNVDQALNNLLGG